jgi:hypothetical protein
VWPPLCAREGEACGLCSARRGNEERRSGLALGRMKMNKGREREIAEEGEMEGIS